MKIHWIANCVCMAMAIAGSAQAAPAGTLLFAQQGTQIVDAAGVTRAAHKGDVLQTGESLQTPVGGISQVQLNDGSLVGVRPASELKMLAPAAGDDSDKGPTLALVSGAARVIGAELMDPSRTSNITVQSGGATLRLKGADLESAVVKADGKSNAGDSAPGSYQHLLVGSGTVANGTAVAALTPKQVSYVGATNTTPVTLANPSLAVFGDNHTAPTGNQTDSNKGAGASTAQTTPKAISIATVPKVVTLPTLPPPAPSVKPCTRFIGKTCIQ